MSSTPAQLTQVTVRALALGGKFIGDGVGYATVTISPVSYTHLTLPTKA